MYTKIALDLSLINLPNDGKTRIFGELSSTDPRELRNWVGLVEDNTEYDYDLYEITAPHHGINGHLVHTLQIKQAVKTPKVMISEGEGVVFWHLYAVRRLYLGGPLEKTDLRYVVNWNMAGSSEETKECNDGLFCNGQEISINGICHKSITLPCESLTSSEKDQSYCNISYVCDEANKRCLVASRQSPGPDNCTSNCMRNTCTPTCGPLDVCGDDGCGGFCGKSACAPDLVCISGRCEPKEPGTCGNPINIAQQHSGSSLSIGFQLPPKMVSQVFNGTLREVKEIGEIQSRCAVNSHHGVVYGFELIQLTGVHAWVKGRGVVLNEALDTVLDIRRMDETCSEIITTPSTNDTTTESLCNDDDHVMPSNGLGSRLSALLTPGRYTIIVSGYDVTQTGPYELHMDFTPDCVSSCNGLMCGVDACGVACGDCRSSLSNQTCDLETGMCETPNCHRHCEANSCGPDGCGNPCKTCKGGSVCSESTHTCTLVQEHQKCDYNHPVCSDEEKPEDDGVHYHYCADDCQWHSFGELLPDLSLPSAEEFQKGIIIAWQEFHDDWKDHCMSETHNDEDVGCISTLGHRLLLKFDAYVFNIGPVEFSLSGHKALRKYSKCTNEWYFDKFYVVELYKGEEEGTPLLRKELKRCIHTTGAYGEHYDNPSEDCPVVANCKSQSIAPMGYHVNFAEEHCQWLDITDLRQGQTYYLKITVNGGRGVLENYYGNNVLSLPVYIPIMDKQR